MPGAVRIFFVLMVLSIGQFIFTAQAQQPYFVETFDEGNETWPFVGSGEGYSISISNGHLIMNGNQTAIHSLKKTTLTEDANFGIYARMIFIDGSHLGWMGIRFMMNEAGDKFCSFVYNNDKGFLIALHNGKKDETLRESKSQVIKPYDYNSLSLVKSGNTYKFLINDKQVFEEKIKSFYGPLVGVMTNANMQMQVDEFQIYDPKVGRKNTSDVKLLSSMDLSSSSGTELGELLTQSHKELPPEFDEFLSNFYQLNFPYYFSPETAKAVEVTNLSFTQKNFYTYVAGNVLDKNMWALGKLSECAEGYALLMMNRYTINRQDVSRFFVIVFDRSGAKVAEKEVGAMVKEDGDFFKVIDFKAYRDGNVVNVEATETFHNGNKQRNSVRYNTLLCNF